MKIDIDPTLQRSFKGNELLIRRLLFPHSDGYLPSKYDAWSTQQLNYLQSFLINFVVNYRKVEFKAVSPSTMRGYIFSIKRFAEVE